MFFLNGYKYGNALKILIFGIQYYIERIGHLIVVMNKFKIRIIVSCFISLSLFFFAIGISRAK